VKPDTAELVALELGGVELRRVPARAVRKTAVAGAEAAQAPAAVGVPVRRAVVAVLGHVDHGKTTLLDSLRRTSVAAGEAGGITQHMGAFVVALPSGGGSLTFLDTPGHAAFTAMRARGAACTDICVLVVAADDGVMPQTIEALAHARAAGCPVVVALTKCDKPSAEPARVRRQLLELGLETEDAGGSIQVVEVCAPTGLGLQQLSEALLLEADALDLRQLDGDAEGVVLEARLDKGHGPLATALLRKGTLAPGAIVIAGAHWGRVRALRDAAGTAIGTAGPSDPVEVAGLRSLPSAGDPFQVVSSEERARRITAARADKAALRASGSSSADATAAAETAAAPVGGNARSVGGGAKAARRVAREAEKAAAAEVAEAAAAEAEEQRELVVVIKADVQGTGEALRDAVQRLSSPAVSVRVIYCGVGPVSESDVDLAAACGAPILAFNVRTGALTDAAAKRAGVKVVAQRVIYHLLDDVGAMLTGLAPEHEAEEVTGEAEVLQLFAAPVPKKAAPSTTAADAAAAQGAGGAAPPAPRNAPSIVGCRVKAGSIHSSERFRVLRGGQPLHPGLIPCRSIRRLRLEVQSVGRGTECGVLLAGSPPLDVRPGDVVQCVRIVRVRARTEAVEGGGLRVTDEAGTA
jgi:translation initiation factor IF-2